MILFYFLRSFNASSLIKESYEIRIQINNALYVAGIYTKKTIGS
jgi:hypothetical protein